MTPLSRYSELAFWSVLPAIIAMGFLVLENSPKYIPGFSSIMPQLHLGVIYFWGLYRPREMPYWFLCLAGLFADTMQGLPIGSSSLLYVLFMVILLSQIRHIHKEGFLIKWGFFTALMLVVTGLQWILMLVLTAKAYPLGPPLLQWLTTVGCYPLIHLLCHKTAELSALRRWYLQHMK